MISINGPVMLRYISIFVPKDKLVSFEPSPGDPHSKRGILSKDETKASGTKTAAKNASPLITDLLLHASMARLCESIAISGLLGFPCSPIKCTSDVASHKV